MSHTIGYVPPVIGGINSSAGAGATWGDIYGNIANQTDLIAQLDLKLDADEKGAANGVATLDANGYVPLAQLPVTVITEVFVVDDEAEMLALTAQVGDVAVRQDESQSYILQGNDPTVLSNWVVLLSPTSDVTSVNGQVGTVLLNADHIDDSATAHKFVTATQVGLIDTAIQPDNIALTNAREWTASTVPQAEAEAGTATTRRAWTAQRVFQAIAAWWNASSAKTKLDGIQTAAEVNQNAFSTVSVSGGSSIQADSKTATAIFAAGTALQLTANSGTDTITFAVTTVPVANGGTGGTSASAARTNLGLGTAATADLTTSTTDTTAGRVLKVRDFGLGAGVSISDFNAISVAPGTSISFSTTFQPANRPPTANLFTGVAWAPQGAGGQITVICADTAGNLYKRQHTGANWLGWVSLLTSDSTIPSTNISGLGTAAAADVTISTSDTTSTRVPTVDWVQAHTSFVPYVQLEIASTTALVTVIGASAGITATIDHQTDATDLVMSFVFGANSGLTKPPTQVTMYVDYGGAGYWSCYPSWHSSGTVSLGSTYLIASGWSAGNFPLTGVTLQQIPIRPFAIPSSSDKVAYLFFN